MNADIDQARADVRDYLWQVREQLRPEYMDGLERQFHRASMMKAAGADSLEYDDDAALELIGHADRDPNIAASLRDVAREFIERGEPLPPNIRRYAAGELAKLDATPKRKQGRRRNQPRDVQIAVAIHIACKHGLKATRSEEPSADAAECGCSIVASVLGDMGIKKVGEKRVREIWRAHEHMRPNKENNCSTMTGVR